MNCPMRTKARHKRCDFFLKSADFAGLSEFFRYPVGRGDHDDETCLVGNEEAKLIGMEGNRYLDDGHSIIAGPFFVCGLTEDDFRGLTEEEVQKYMNKYAEPENISQEEVEADTGFMLYPM